MEKLQRLNLLTRKHEFVSTSGLVSVEDESYAEIYSEDVKILWLGCAYPEVTHLLEALQIKPIVSFTRKMQTFLFFS